jgi:hypothetical protein
VVQKDQKLATRENMWYNVELIMFRFEINVEFILKRIYQFEYYRNAIW